MRTKSAQLLEECDLMDKAAGVLLKSLGPVETARFFAICTPKRMCSVKRHREWQSGLNKKDFLDKLFCGGKSIQ